MKKFTALLMITLLAAAMLVPVSATDKPVITLQPQNSVYPEFASALWSVEATGENLSYNWYIVYNGTAYRTADSFAENHPWLNGVTGSGYGSNETGDTFFVDGIGSALDGALIYCVVSNEAGSATSESAYISVSGKKFPPQLNVPASVTVEQYTVVKLFCEAETTGDDSVSSYAWFETPTGQLKDIVAIGSYGDQPEEDPVLVCDTSTPGTRYYVCHVMTKLGGVAYSSVIPVTVTEKTVVPPPPPESSDLTDSQAASAPDYTSEPASTLPSDGETSPAGSGGETSPAGSDGETSPAGSDGETSPAGSDGETSPAGSDGETSPAGSGGETSPAGSGGHTGTDSVPEEKGDSRGTVIIVLAAVCGVLLGSCIVLAAASFRKKK